METEGYVREWPRTPPLHSNHLDMDFGRKRVLSRGTAGCNGQIVEQQTVVYSGLQWRSPSGRSSTGSFARP